MRGLPLVLASLVACAHEGDDAGECSDAADNDRDGLFDCDDSDCTGSPDCEGLNALDDSLCTQTCERLYSEEGCEIQRPGRDSENLILTCLDYCLEAWAVEGEVGDYDPYERATSNASITLENQAQAELWAQCVADLSCEELQNGYCAPIW